MSFTRRSFLGSLLALSAAPAIVRADSLMKVVPMNGLVLWGDGIHDDAEALNALIHGEKVVRRDGAEFFRSPEGGVFLHGGTFLLGSTLVFPHAPDGHALSNLILTSKGQGPVLEFLTKDPVPPILEGQLRIATTYGGIHRIKCDFSTLS